MLVKYNRESILSQIDIVESNTHRLRLMIELDLVLNEHQENVCAYCCMNIVNQANNIQREISSKSTENLLIDAPKEIAEKFVGKCPDSNNKPSWEEIRNSCSLNIERFAAKEVNKVLSIMENQIMLQIQQQKLNNSIKMYDLDTLEATLIMIKEQYKTL